MIDKVVHLLTRCSKHALRIQRGQQSTDSALNAVVYSGSSMPHQNLHVDSLQLRELLAQKSLFETLPVESFQRAQQAYFESERPETRRVYLGQQFRDPGHR